MNYDLLIFSLQYQGKSAFYNYMHILVGIYTNNIIKLPTKKNTEKNRLYFSTLHILKSISDDLGSWSGDDQNL